VIIKSADQMRDFIEAERTAQAMTFRALATQSGFAHAGYWFWVKKKGRVTLDNALAACATLGIRVELTK
jgi:hypothetical protein